MSKNPYKALTLKEAQKAEATLWYIQVGKQFFDYEGQCLWEKEEAENFYFTIRDGLEHMLRSDDPKEQADALDILTNFRLLPLRFA